MPGAPLANLQLGCVARSSQWTPAFAPFADALGSRATARSWPGPEILAINLIAENQPFDSTWHEKFRCNRHGRLMAGSVKSSMTIKGTSHIPLVA